MGCLQSFGKLFLFFSIFFVIALLMVSFFIDITFIFAGDKPYFFDSDKIDSYDEPIFEGVEEKLIANYKDKTFEFQNVEDYIPYLPEGERFEVDFSSRNTATFSGDYAEGWQLKSGIDYTDRENISFLSELGWTVPAIKDLKSKLDDINCNSIERKDGGLRVGFLDKKSGTYYYLENQLADHHLFFLLNYN